MNYGLPVEIDVNGTTYAINSDYRAVLDICTALSDAELSPQEKATVALGIFYPTLEEIPPEAHEEALRRCFWFIDGGDEPRPKQKSPRLVSWEQDIGYIIPPINRVAGMEIRAAEYIHWWTFLGFYQEIGDCTFAQIVRIRDLKARGKRPDKTDAEWYRRNRHLVDIKTTFTEAENNILKQWGGG